MDYPVPVFILSGFLGSGKTTLLSRAVSHVQAQGRKPAVVMNELGEVNLDGIALGVQVPMAEMLDGCICCTVRGDLGITIQQLIKDEAPDIIFIEATGVANPIEIVDGVTEASLYTRMEMKGIITVADAAFLQDQLAKASGQTYRLLEEQVRLASVIVLNKTDLAAGEKLEWIEAELKAWNPHADIIRAVQAQVDLNLLDGLEGKPAAWSGENGGDVGRSSHNHEAGKHSHHSHDEGCSCHEHSHGTHDESGGHAHQDHGSHAHHSHEHVMVYTRYLKGSVDSVAFEELVGRLPESVYRAKGILTFSDTASRYLFQYAYRQADFMKIAPQIEVPDVVVFIGEQIPRLFLEEELAFLEKEKS